MAHSYNLQQLHHFDFSAIMEATTDESKVVACAMKVGLLERSMLCPHCAQPMRLNARKRYWRCCRRTCHADGKQEQFSIFPQAAHMARVSENTASAWYAACRVLCSKELLSGEFKITGEGHIVEIDETNLKKKSKYGRGRTYQETRIHSDMFASYVASVAILKNPDILVLDEGTSALGSESETVV
ncbi:hypothetical protein PInf_005012 [Phytophthora infestans]|nr:hypothetical protein PInf_005012 [Phytophthora infestans]